MTLGALIQRVKGSRKVGTSRSNSFLSPQPPRVFRISFTVYEHFLSWSLEQAKLEEKDVLIKEIDVSAIILIII